MAQSCPESRRPGDAERTQEERRSPASMPDAFSFRLLATDGAARRGEIATAHGTVATRHSCRSAPKQL